VTKIYKNRFERLNKSRQTLCSPYGPMQETSENTKMYFLKVNKYQNERNVLCLCFNCSAALSAPFYDDTSDLIS